MKISSNMVNKISFVYLSIPLIIFLIGWLKPFYAILSLFALGYILFRILKDNYLKSNIFKYDIGFIVITAIIAYTWCHLSGIGGLFWQAIPDWPFRNVIMHDLINFQHPVIYNNGSALVYYFTYMLPGAIVGKLFNIIIPEGYLTFQAANIFSLIWSFIGIFILFLQITQITKSNNVNRFIVILMFIFFSGLDIFCIDNPYFYDIEWHAPFSIPSNMASLLFTYHSAIPIWLSMGLFIQYWDKLKYYGAICIFPMLYSPLTLFAILPFLFVTAVKKFFLFWRKHKLFLFFKNIFCLSNILIALFIFPFIYLFYKSNFTSSHYFFYFNRINSFGIKCIICELFVYLFILFPKNYKDLKFQILIIVSAILPFVAYKTDYDFCLKACVPLTFIIFTYIIKFLFNDDNKYKFLKYILVISLVIGIFTPVDELLHMSILNYIKHGAVIKDSIGTFNNKIFETYSESDIITDYKNYGAVNINDYFFWKHLAKRNYSKRSVKTINKK